MVIVFHARPYGIFIDIRKKFCGTIQDSNFLGGKSSNRDNVRTPI